MELQIYVHMYVYNTDIANYLCSYSYLYSVVNQIQHCGYIGTCIIHTKQLRPNLLLSRYTELSEQIPLWMVM